MKKIAWAVAILLAVSASSVLDALPAAWAGVPPQAIALDKGRIKQLGFHYTIAKRGRQSSIELSFPEKIDEHYLPHSVTVIVKNRKGEILSRSTNWIDGSNYRTINNDFDSEQADVAISLTVCDANLRPCQGAREYRIESVSGFIGQYAVTGSDGMLQGQW